MTFKEAIKELEEMKLGREVKDIAERYDEDRIPHAVFFGNADDTYSAAYDHGEEDGTYDTLVVVLKLLSKVEEDD
jgi:hypothetical protein